MTCLNIKGNVSQTLRASIDTNSLSHSSLKTTLHFSLVLISNKNYLNCFCGPCQPFHKRNEIQLNSAIQPILYFPLIILTNIQTPLNPQPFIFFLYLFNEKGLTPAVFLYPDRQLRMLARHCQTPIWLSYRRCLSSIIS